jgi:hypothetical protein
MKKKIKPNIRLLRRIQRAILNKSNQFQMSSLFSAYLDNCDRAGGCGTAGCIAGWALHLTSRNQRLDKTSVSRKGVNTLIREAGNLLGIPTVNQITAWSQMKHPLFFAEEWPEPFATRYSNARTAKTMARIAASRIEHFIKTGK